MVTINMISTFGYDPKGNQVVEASSLSSHKAVDDAIQCVFDVHTDDIDLMALDPYHLPY